MFSSAWSLSFALAGTVVAVGIVMMPFALLVVAGILRQRRSPASSLAWLLAILLLPLIGIPLFWLFGSRKIKRIAKAKPPVELTIVEPAAAAAPHPDAAQAAAHLGPASITRGNDLKFHDNGEAAFADFIALIDGAQQSIHIETYVLKADATGSAIIERLIARAQKGVEVRLLIDGFGSFHLARRPLRRLRRAGGNFSCRSGVSPCIIAATCATIARSLYSMASVCLQAAGISPTNTWGRNRIPSVGGISRSCSPVQRRRITKRFSAMTGPSQAARCHGGPNRETWPHHEETR